MNDPTSLKPPGRRIHLWALGLGFALVIGAFFRLIWVEDMEYKLDEWYSFEYSMHPERLPSIWTGMPTSVGFTNHGASVWIFVGLSRLTGVQSPPDLARTIQSLNVAALLLLTFFALRIVRLAEREPWLWAIALIAVNPLAVLFQRKIWPPTVLPLFLVIFLICWWYRDRRIGAFLGGLLGVLMAEVHLSVVFLVGGFTLWAFLFDRRRTCGIAAIAGMLVAGLTLIPWLLELGGHAPSNSDSKRYWYNVFGAKFWIFWISDSFGFSLHYVLGKDFVDFLKQPIIGSTPTWLVAGLHAVVGVLAGAFAIRIAARLWARRANWRNELAGPNQPTAFTLQATFWGSGLAIASSMVMIHRHYLIVFFIFTSLSVSSLAFSNSKSTVTGRFRARAFLFALCIFNGSISASFLCYIHENPRMIQGHYGTPYRAIPNGPSTDKPFSDDPGFF